MITRHEREGMTWVDIESGIPEEVHSVIEEFGVSPRIEQEIIAPTPYPLFVSSLDHHYLVLHFPTTDSGGGAKNQEIDIIAGNNFLITVRYELVDSLQALHRAFEAEELLGIPKEGGGVLIERVLRHLYGAINEETERVARRLERIEQDIFSGRERQTVKKISEAGRVLLRFDMTLARHAEPLSSFLRELSTSDFYGKRFAEEALRIETERAHASSLVSSYRAVASELRTTNDSLLSASQNEAMKTFTAIVLGTSPLSLIAITLTIPAKSTPILGLPYDFWIIIAIMVVVDILMFWYLRTKRWI